MIRLPLVCLAIVCLCLPAPAAAQNAAVQGRVLDAQGAVIVDALVLLEGAAASLRTVAGRDGQFTFPSVPPGPYVLRVRSDGFADWSREITVAGPLTVDVALEVGGLGESLEVVGGVQASLDARADAGSRLPMTRLETPAAVHALTGEVIRERGDRTVEEAETRIVGVTTQGSLGNGGGSRMARGFGGPNSIVRLYDGSQILVGQGTMTFPFDSWTVERLEYLAGPASVLYGAGAIGGALNVVPRRPTHGRTAGQARLTLGTQETVRAAAGVGGPFSNRLAYRVDLSHNRSAGVVDRGDWNTTAASGSLGFQVAPKLYLKVANEFGYQEPYNYWGSPVIAGQLDKALREVNYNVADATTNYRDNWTQVRADWAPASNVAVRSNVTAVNSQRQWRNSESYTYQPTTQLVTRSSYTEIIQYLQQYGGHSDVLVNTEIFGRANVVSAGFDYTWFRYQRDRNAGSYSTTVPLTGFDPGLFFNTTPTTPEYRAIQNRYSSSIENRLSVTRQLSLVAGLRWDRYDLEREDLRTGDITPRTFDPVNWRGGVVYAVVPTLSFYGQYATATDPVNTLISLSPVEQGYDLTPGRQVEGGVKQSLWNGRGEWTVTGYRIVKEKLLVPDPLDSLRRIQIGQQSSKGIELSTGLAISQQVRVDANFSALDARYDDYTEVVGGVLTSWNGKTPTGIPERTANLWVVWRPLTEWQLQTGIRFVGERYLDTANTATAPSVTLVDAGLRRRFGNRLGMDVRASNLLDKFYLQSVTGFPVATRGRYAAPRTVELTFDLGF